MFGCQFNKCSSAASWKRNFINFIACYNRVDNSGNGFRAALTETLTSYGTGMHIHDNRFLNIEGFPITISGRGCVVRDNYIENWGKSLADGLFATIHSSSTLLAGISAISAYGAKIHGNTIRMTGTWATNTHTAGFEPMAIALSKSASYAEASDYCSIESNTSDGVYRALYEGASCDRNFWLDNTIIGATVRDFRSGVYSTFRYAKGEVPGYLSGRWYRPIQAEAATGAAWPNNTTIYFGLIEIPERMLISRIYAQISTVSAAGNFQLAIYANSRANSRPGVLLANTASQSTAALGIPTAAPNVVQGDVMLEPGFYWVGCIVDNTTAVLVGTNGIFHGARIGTAAVADLIGLPGAQLNGYSLAGQVFGTWPADLTGTAVTNSISTRHPSIGFLSAV